MKCKLVTIVLLLMLQYCFSQQNHHHFRIHKKALNRLESLINGGPLLCRELAVRTQDYSEIVITFVDVTFKGDSCDIIINNNLCKAQRLYVFLADSWYNLEWILRGNGVLPQTLAKQNYLAKIKDTSNRYKHN